MGQRFRDVDSTLLYDGRRRRAAFWMRYWLCPASNLAPAPGFAATPRLRSSRLRRGPIIIGGLPFDRGRRLHNASGNRACKIAQVPPRAHFGTGASQGRGPRPRTGSLAARGSTPERSHKRAAHR